MYVGKVIGGRYHIRQRLGEGGFAVVWRAEDIFRGVSLGDVAVKQFKEQPNLKEIEVLANIKHDNIIHFKNLVEEGNTVFLITEYADGGSLADLVGAEKSYPNGLHSDAVENYIVPVIEAVVYLHSCNIVHRDIKPANILLSGSKPKLSDVGLAKSFSGELTRHTAGKMTCGYTAPEMFRRQVGPKSDVYAVGCTAYKLLTGRLPFEGTPEEVILDHLQNQPSIPAQLPEKWRSFLERCLEKDHAKRPTAEEALWLLRENGERLRPPMAEGQDNIVVAGALPLSKRTDRVKGVEFEMVTIPAGRFLMGSPENEEGRSEDETQHEVTISRAFEMQSTLVTKGLYRGTKGWWRMLNQSNPSDFEGDPALPVGQVSWFDAVAFCNTLSELKGLQKCYMRSFYRKVEWDRSADGYRLPTEAEWEYACRAGTTGARYGTSHWDEVANSWGLYEMPGYMEQWVWDWHTGYPSGSVTDPTGPSEGSYRVIRGGGKAFFLHQCCRSANRAGNSPGFCSFMLGFRLARSLP